MRTTITASLVALAAITMATASEAQNFGNNNGGRNFNGGQGGVSQRSFNQGGQRFERGEVRQFDRGNQFGNANRRSLPGIQPPAPGNQAGNRTFRSVQPPAPSVQPPQPGNQAGNRTFRSVQPPAPSVQPPQPGNQAGNPTFRSVQPPAAGVGSGSVRPPIGQAFQPPIGAPAIPSAVTGSVATAAALGTVGVIAATSAATASRAPAGTVSPVGSAPVLTTQASPVITAQSSDGTPPIEMLAPVGEPIMPLAQAPEGTSPGTTAVATSTSTSALLRHQPTRTLLTAENCNVPNHHAYRFWRRY